MRGPVRTCIGCGGHRPQSALLRFVRRSDGHLVVATGTLVGRTAYLCPSRRCFAQLDARKATRAWRGRGRVEVDAESLWSDVRAHVTATHARLEAQTARGTGDQLVRWQTLAQLITADGTAAGTAASPTRGS